MGPLAEQSSVLHALQMAEDVGAARRAARELAIAFGASDAEVGRVELCVTELGTNTLSYARPPGYLLLQSLAPRGERGLEILAVDHGPGIGNLAEMIHGVASRFQSAGHQPGRGLGCGLASVKRLASEFDAHSVPGQGTVVLARIRFGQQGEPSPREFLAGGVSLPLAGEVANGDAWAFAHQPDGCALMIADGLGHGPQAARASAAAVSQFRADPLLDVERFLSDAHCALRGTRGAAVSACRIFSHLGVVRFAGLGNVEGRTHLAGSSESLSPRSGTVGMNIAPHAVRARELSWEPGATLILHSDGIRHLFDLRERRDLAGRDPSVIAAVLHRELTRGRDDATVVVVRDLRARP